MGVHTLPKGTGEKVNVILQLDWLDFVLWHINHCRLFNAKSIFIHIDTT